MTLPKFLAPFLEEASEYVEKGQVQEIEFSGSTYQVKVLDSDYPEGAWAFLQFGFKDQLTDNLCSCDAFEEGVGCVHVASACLKIYNGHSTPLHLRFNRSFWNHLCQELQESWAGEEKIFLRSDEGSYITESFHGKNFIEITPKTTENDLFLADLLYRSPLETEETSLKFSNLSQEEIALWKQGRPSAALQYELSFWSDLARFMMNQQEEGLPQKIEFLDESPHSLPKELKITFTSMVFKCSIKEEQWLSLIPTLSTVASPLKVEQLSIESENAFHYDQKSATFTIGSNTDSVEKQKPTGGIKLPGWTYFPKVGFYPDGTKKRFKQNSLKGEQISEFLTTHGSLVQKEIQGSTFHDYPLFPSYKIHFTKEWDLIITTYLFEPKDLSSAYSRIFGDFAYLQDDGFYRLEGKLFKDVETKIPSHEVNDFIRLHRGWLNAQEGFNTHVTQLQSQLTYKVDLQDGSLQILHQIDSSVGGQVHNFGDWLYIKDEGFYSSSHSLDRTRLIPGSKISKSQVSSFIDQQKEELAHLPHFFTELKPIKRFALTAELQENGTLLIEPTYEFYEEKLKANHVFYDSYIYIENLGFSKLPIDPKIPEKFHNTQILKAHELEDFLKDEWDQLQPFTLNRSQELIKPKNLFSAIAKLEAVPRNEGKYKLLLNYCSELGETSAQEICEALHSKELFFPSKAGLLDLRQKRFDWLRSLDLKTFDHKTGEIELSSWELIKLQVIDGPKIPTKPHSKDIKLYLEIIGEGPKKKSDLTGFQATLRPYQELGLEWLWFLYTQHLSGILSDDMGLGKTLQALSLIVSIINSSKEKKRKPKFLVVCPTSVLYHWQDKIHQFFPQLKIYTHFGNQRNIAQFDASCDLFLTTYGVLRIDKKKMKKHSFTLAIFDEVQVAKNHTSLLYSALQTVSAKMRLGLTGTPIENSTRELKAIFDLLLPGYLPKEEAFKTLFLNPIEKEGDMAAMHELNRLVHPFILRRKKEEVLTELPEKVEEIAHCPLSLDQYKLYQDVLQLRQPLFDNMEGSSYIHIFSILSKLKQICNHPAAYLKTPHDYQKYSSGKWDLFKELFQEALASGQKIVIFSQFLQMLDIMELYFNHLGIPFASIRGATADRRSEIERFQNDDNCRVFLGSLQASGLGIELTAASIVIHYDRWWNAAREDQATDRVHRMGQKRGVQVYKLVTKDSFEERIDEMIRSKAKLTEEIIGYDDQEVLKKLTKEELMFLLSDIPKPLQD